MWNLKKKKNKLLVTESRMVVTRSWGKRKIKKKNDDSQELKVGGPGELLFNGNRISVLR